LKRSKTCFVALIELVYFLVSFLACGLNQPHAEIAFSLVGLRVRFESRAVKQFQTTVVVKVIGQVVLERVELSRLVDRARQLIEASIWLWVVQEIARCQI
jgi:hypothetical protein